MTNPESFWGLRITPEVNNSIRRKDENDQFDNR